MRIAKAKLKNLEELPEVWLCCDAYLEFYKEHGDEIVEIDLDDIIDIPAGLSQCSSCKTPRPAYKGYHLLAPYEEFHCVIPLMDIDEG